MYEIRFHIIEEILSHAFNYFPKIEADPLENEVLSQLGHPQLNFHLEKLNEIDLVKINVSKKENSNNSYYIRSNWIGYRLTEKGVKLSKSKKKLLSFLQNHFNGRFGKTIGK